MSQSSLDVPTALYIDALQSQSLHDRSLEGAILDIILANILAELSNPDAIAQGGSSPPPADVSQNYGCFQKSELLMFGTPVRHHLNPSTRRLLLEEINEVLSSIANFLHGGSKAKKTHFTNLSNPFSCIYSTAQRSEENDSFCILPKRIQNLKDGIQSKQQEINQQSQRIIDQILEISQIREKFERKLKQATSTTFSTYDASRSASIDLLLATIETTLIKLSLIRARSERALYNHRPKNEIKHSKTVSQALALAFKSLQKEEKEMKIEALSLDRQLDEYEMMMQLVDGGKITGGYQQVVNDWTKVKQETDECKKDLRRLGWTGD